MLFTPIKPMLLSNHKVTPFSLTDPHLLYEPKYDGWRLQLHKSGSRVEIYTRHGNVITHCFPEFVEAAAGIQAHSVILDCEGVCFHPEKKRPDLGLFASRAKLTDAAKITAAMVRHPATLIVFDVILINERSLCAELILNRKKILSEIIKKLSVLMPTPFVVGDGSRLYDWTLQNQWEGICAKHISSRYRINRRPDSLQEAWVKRKHTETVEASILGYKQNPFALMVGLQNEDCITPDHVGLVEFGLTSEEKVAFTQIARKMHTVKRREIQFIEPVLKCTVEYLERTESGALRTCTFRGFVTSDVM